MTLAQPFTSERPCRSGESLTESEPSKLVSQLHCRSNVMRSRMKEALTLWEGHAFVWSRFLKRSPANHWAEAGCLRTRLWRCDWATRRLKASSKSLKGKETHIGSSITLTSLVKHNKCKTFWGEPSDGLCLYRHSDSSQQDCWDSPMLPSCPDGPTEECVHMCTLFPSVYCMYSQKHMG